MRKNQKNQTPSNEQQMVIKKAGLEPLYYVVIKELRSNLIIKDRRTGEVSMIEK